MVRHPPPYSLDKKQQSQNLWCWITDRIKMPWLWISSNALHNNYSPVCTEVQIIEKLLWSTAVQLKPLPKTNNDETVCWWVYSPKISDSQGKKKIGKNFTSENGCYASITSFLQRGFKGRIKVSFFHWRDPFLNYSTSVEWASAHRKQHVEMKLKVRTVSISKTFSLQTF